MRSVNVKPRPSRGIPQRLLRKTSLYPKKKGLPKVAYRLHIKLLNGTQDPYKVYRVRERLDLNGDRHPLRVSPITNLVPLLYIRAPREVPKP